MLTEKRYAISNELKNATCKHTLTSFCYPLIKLLMKTRLLRKSINQTKNLPKFPPHSISSSPSSQSGFPSHTLASSRQKYSLVHLYLSFEHMYVLVVLQFLHGLRIVVLHRLGCAVVAMLGINVVRDRRPVMETALRMIEIELCTC